MLARRARRHTASRRATSGSCRAAASARATSPSPTCRRATSRSRPRAARSTRPRSTPSAIDLIIVATSTPDMVFPSTACIVQQKLGIAQPVRRVRPAGGLQRLRVRDDDGRRVHPRGPGDERARDRRRGVLAHPRLHRPHHLRAVRRRRRRGRADARPSGPACSRASCTRTAATSASCACRATSTAAPSSGNAVPAHGRTGGLQARRQRAREGRARDAGGRERHAPTSSTG